MGAYEYIHMFMRVAYRHPPLPKTDAHRPHTTLCTIANFIKNATFREVRGNMKKINVLGTEYTIEYRHEKDDVKLEDCNELNITE